MSQSARQRNLFAAEDFTVIYDSFKQSNFQSYDYDTIKNAMVDYIRNKYPENFNDWIKSSEFVSLIELMAFMGHNLAFRADLAVRENFLSTAERRESVLRISDYLGYNAARQFPASGFLKIKTIKTTQNVFDIKGKTLKNKVISYFDSANPTTYQDFLLIMNEIFGRNARFGSPIDSANINGIDTQLYKLNTVFSDRITIPFRGLVNGINQQFEIHNVTFSENNDQVIEPSPNPLSGFNIIYKNDRQGLGSTNTGFFVGFKQGVLQSSDFKITNPIPNMAIDISNQNINNSDVWVQNINTNGYISAEWTKLEKTFGVSALFNALDKNIRKVFSVKTLDNNAISVVFGDGTFSEIPNDTIRVWYRTSVNQSYILNPDDIGSISFTINYTGTDNNEYTATITADLEESVTNASAAESLISIKENAGRVFATQDRMVTAADYNIYPLSVTNNVIKIKSINRTYSGHSRFIPQNDPTGQYQNVNIFGDDGYLYTQNVLAQDVLPLPTTFTDTQIYDLYIKKVIEDPEIINFYYQNYTPYNVLYPTTGTPPIEIASSYFVWQQLTSGQGASSGYLTRIETVGSDQVNQVKRIGVLSDSVELRQFNRGSIVLFSNADNTENIWARVIDTYQDGLGLDDVNGTPTGIDINGFGSIKLSKPVPDKFVVRKIYPGYNKRFSQSEKNDITNEIKNKNTFGLRYDAVNMKWKVITSVNLANLVDGSENTYSTQYAGNSSGNNLDNSWILRFDYRSTRWTITTRKFRVIFGSDKTVRFYNPNGKLKFNVETGKPEKDKVRLLAINSKPSPNPNNEPLGEYVDMFISSYFTEPNGYTDDHKVIMTTADADNDGYPDNPISLANILGSNTITLATFTDEDYSYVAYSPTGTVTANGRADLKFQWTKISDMNKRIDPSISNIIDTFVLTSNYDNAYRRWLSTDKNMFTKPNPPTNSELSLQFSGLDTKKSISDTVIYRSVKYRTIFGKTADIGLQGNFRVVKSAGTSLTDTEIKSRILDNIQSFFNINNWDFGETFYFTELAAYIHNRMSGIVGSIVIVPVQEGSSFGNLFQVTPNSDELFIPDVTLENIEIVTAYTEDNLRIRR